MPRTALVARDPGPVAHRVCVGLAEVGFDVAVGFDQAHDEAEAAADAAREAGREAVALGGRVGDPMAASTLVTRVQRELGAPPEALVLAPRTRTLGEPAPAGDDAQALLDLDLGRVETVLQADLKGPLSLLQAAAGAMREGEGGRVVLCAADAAARAGPAGLPGQAAARGLAALAETAADALAPDVAVNAVVPGAIAPADADTAPAGAVAPGELADAIVHLATGPPALTGQTLALPPGGPTPAVAREHDDEAAEDLPGIEQRVEPPDPDERIDVGEPGVDEPSER